MKKTMISLVLILASTGLWAQNALKPVQVNVFKNGTYFIAKEGQVQMKKGQAMIELPENPLMGTYWMNTTKDNKITDVYFLTDTIKKTKSPQNFSDIFKGSIGKKVRVSYWAGGDKNPREATGVLMEFYEGSGIAKIRTADSKTTFITIQNLVDFTLEDASVEKLSVDSLVRVARINFEKEARSADLRVVYMQTGIQWFPQYNIKIVNDNELQLEMKALVENYAEDIENAELTLTVGNPQFYFGNSLDPIYSNYLTSLSMYAPSGRTATIPVQDYSFQSNVYVAEERNSNIPQYNQYYDYSTEGEKTNDLYIYKIGNVSLPKQSKTAFQIFATKIPYKDSYEVNLGDVSNYSYYGYISNDPEKRYDVYHSLKLSNNTQIPFTTAPVFVLNENLMPLAQDRIKYTPVGATVSVQLSKAGDVAVKNKEEEVKKEENVKKIGKVMYNRVTIKGVIYIENLQNKKISLIITKNLLADVKNSSDGGKVTKSGRYSGLNPYTDINWEIPCAAGEKKSVTYEYEVYAPAAGSSY